MTEKAPETALAERVLRERPDHFDDEEIAALRSIAGFYLGMQAVGRAAGVLQRVLIWVGWAIGLYLAVKAGAIDWIRGIR
jgi:hypothetical protein